MNVGGIQEFSLSDFKGEVCSILFTKGCNFKCAYCHNPSLIPFDGPIDASHFEKALSFLEQQKSKVTGIVVSGGEPTCQPQLECFLKYIKNLGLKVKLDTNGSRFSVIKKLIENHLIDYVAMDLKAPLSKYKSVVGVGVNIDVVQKSVALLKESGIAHEFRTTAVFPLLTQNDIAHMGQHLVGESLWYLQKYKSYPFSTPNNFCTVQGLEDVACKLRAIHINCYLR